MACSIRRNQSTVVRDVFLTILWLNFNREVAVWHNESPSEDWH